MVGKTHVTGRTWLDARRSQKLSEDLVRHELELAKIQLTRVRDESQAEKKAVVSARLYKGEKGHRVRVFNAGPSEARNVRLLLDENNQLVSQEAIGDKLPLDKMERGQSVDFWAFVHLQSPTKEYLTISWDDASGDGQTNKVELTV